MQASDQLATKAPAVASNDAGQESPPDLVCTTVVLEERGDERENDGETQQVQQEIHKQDHERPVRAWPAHFLPPVLGLRLIGLHVAFFSFTLQTSEL
jgi:hypothetical protein